MVGELLLSSSGLLVGVALTSGVPVLVTVALSVKVVLFQHMMIAPAVVASLKIVRLFAVSCPSNGKKPFHFHI